MTDADAVWRRLAGGSDLDGLGLGHRDGRWDLRSIAAPRTPWSKKDPNPTLRKVQLTGLDLTGAQLQHFRLFDVSVTDCVFDGADLFDWRMWGCHVQEVRFVGADLRSSGLGGDLRSPNDWTTVAFDQADLRGTSHVAGAYTDCSFAQARVKGVDFDGSRHRRSTFAGPVEDVQFRALPKGQRRGRWVNPMERVDFAAAVVRFPTFEKVDLSSCVLPASPDHLKFDQRRVFAEAVLREIRGSAVDQPYLRSVMEGHARDAVDGGGGPGFQHRKDLGETLEEIAEAERLMRLCGAY